MRFPTNFSFTEKCPFPDLPELSVDFGRVSVSEDYHVLTTRYSVKDLQFQCGIDTSTEIVQFYVRGLKGLVPVVVRVCWPWPCKLSERRDKILSRVQAPSSLGTIYVAANALLLTYQ